MGRHLRGKKASQRREESHDPFCEDQGKPVTGQVPGYLF